VGQKALKWQIRFSENKNIMYNVVIYGEFKMDFAIPPTFIYKWVKWNNNIEWLAINLSTRTIYYKLIKRIVG